MEDIEKCIQAIRNALALLTDSPEYAHLHSAAAGERGANDISVDIVTVWFELSVALGDRFKHIGQLGDLEEQIRTLRLALGYFPDDPKNASWVKLELGAALRTRFENYGDFQDIAEVFTLRSSILSQLPAVQPRYHWVSYTSSDVPSSSASVNLGMTTISLVVLR